jgi:hypothetical protein
MIELHKAKALITTACEYDKDSDGHWICAHTKVMENALGNGYRFSCCAHCKPGVRDACSIDNQPSVCLSFCCETLRKKILATKNLQEAWGALQVEALRRKAGGI